MRKSKVETAKTRERILKAAGAEFAANGITEAALARVMAAAGLTHGGFYRHFASKDQLVAEACSKTLLSLIASLESRISGRSPEKALPLLLDIYVSRAHRNQPRTGCPLAALGSARSRSTVDGDRRRHGGRRHAGPHCARLANFRFCPGWDARLYRPIRAAVAIAISAGILVSCE